MRVYHEGDTTKEALIFFNPMGTDFNFWKKKFPLELYKKYEVCFFDYSGFNSNYLPQANLSDTAEMIKNEILSGINKPMHFCGYSYGGMVVQELLKEQYSNLQSVILIATQNCLTPYDKEVSRVLKDVINVDLLLYCRMLSLLSQTPSVLNTNQLFPLQMLFNINSSTISLSPIIQQLEQLSKINKIDFPPCLTSSLYMYGENDRMIRSDTPMEMKNKFKDLKVIKFSGASHMIDLDLIYKEIIIFLNNTHR